MQWEGGGSGARRGRSGGAFGLPGAACVALRARAAACRILRHAARGSPAPVFFVHLKPRLHFRHSLQRGGVRPPSSSRTAWRPLPVDPRGGRTNGRGTGPGRQYARGRGGFAPTPLLLMAAEAGGHAMDGARLRPGIPNQAMGRLEQGRPVPATALRRVHLDTWALMAALVGGKFEDHIRRILQHSGPESYSPVASQTALGEADAVILRRGPGAALMLRGLLGLLADYRAEPGRCMPPINGAVLAIIRELVRVVPGLDMADRIILAHALADPDSWFLTTSD